MVGWMAVLDKMLGYGAVGLVDGGIFVQESHILRHVRGIFFVFTLL